MKKILLALSLLLTTTLPMTAAATAQVAGGDGTVSPNYVPEEPTYNWSSYSYRKTSSRIVYGYLTKYMTCDWTIYRIDHYATGGQSSAYPYGWVTTDGASVITGTPPPCPTPHVEPMYW